MNTVPYKDLTMCSDVFCRFQRSCFSSIIDGDFGVQAGTMAFLLVFLSAVVGVSS